LLRSAYLRLSSTTADLLTEGLVRRPGNAQEDVGFWTSGIDPVADHNDAVLIPFLERPPLLGHLTPESGATFRDYRVKLFAASCGE
jgi:hypothetical protein